MTKAPIKFSKEIGEEICRRIISGLSLKKVCEQDDMPHRDSVHRWLLDENKKDFYDSYTRAVNIRAERMFDEIEEISDNTSNESVNRDRLRVDTRKWKLAKMMPKKFGDKLDVTTDGEKLPTPIIDIAKIKGKTE